MTTEIEKTKRTDLMLVDPRNIINNEEFNIRTDYGDIEELASSIKMNGVEIPLKAQKIRNEDKYELIDGFRRMRAINLLLSRGEEVGLIPVTIYKGNTEDKIFTMLITGTGQKSLTEVEQAEAIKRLINLNYDVKDIAVRLGKSVPHIYNVLHLANAPKEVKDMVGEGLVSGNTVVQVMKSSPNEVTAIIKKAVSTAKGKVTSKNVTEIKTKSVNQKLLELADELQKREISNDKTEFLLDLLSVAKTGSVEDLVQLFVLQTA